MLVYTKPTFWLYKASQSLHSECSEIHSTQRNPTIFFADIHGRSIYLSYEFKYNILLWAKKSLYEQHRRSSPVSYIPKHD